MKTKKAGKLSLSKVTIANLKEMSKVIAGGPTIVPITGSSCDETACITVKYCGDTEINCSWPC